MRTATLRATVVALALMAMLGACGGDDDDQTGSVSATGTPAENTVLLKDLAFKPAEIEVEAGDTVHWKWDDGSIAYNVVGKGFKSELITEGTFEHTFETTGKFDYTCTVHPTMKGEVVVK